MPRPISTNMRRRSKHPPRPRPGATIISDSDSPSSSTRPRSDALNAILTKHWPSSSTASSKSNTTLSYMHNDDTKPPSDDISLGLHRATTNASGSTTSCSSRPPRNILNVNDRKHFDEDHFCELENEPIKNVLCDTLNCESEVNDYHFNEGSTKSSAQSSENQYLQFQDHQLYNGSSITRRESLLLIFSHIIRLNTSGSALNSLLNLIQFHLPDNTYFPASKYLFEKHFNGTGETIQYHAFCPQCICYIGQKNMDCSNCGKEVLLEECLKSGNYFIIFDIKEQLLNILNDADTAKHLWIGTKRKSCDSFRQTISVITPWK
ncbi:uncharacterized protein LOC117115306 isoform X2 [Anneissia japonica]|uniref:uncharacterized protein LOC117115306 isoform X2 n=1 Tax=Anneissia japonica TaxID=1529436 RepID=UPI0014259E74|nr:uncharacterized protein LOC117115306 isoform X2 [Anneissia japonica]